MSAFSGSSLSMTTPWSLSKLTILSVFLHAMVAAAAGTNTESAGPSTHAVLGIAGNLIAIFNCLYPIFTFVMPVRKEGSVGDRMVYASLLAFLNNVMWAMYAASDSFRSKLFFFIVNGVAFSCHIFYIIVYIYYAEGRKRIRALRLLFAFCGVAFLMAMLVASMVMTQRWSSNWVDVLAATSGVSVHIFSAVDMVIVMKSKRIIYIDRVITAFASLAAAYIWTVYGFISAPVNFYVVVPNLVGILSATVQTVVYSYLITRKTRIHSFYTDDAVDYSYEMGKLFASSPV